MERYCKLCGNEKTSAEDGIGNACRELLQTSLKRAWAFWQACDVENRMCCGGVSSDRTHIYFHGKGWEGSYPAIAKADDPLQVAVEMGVSFYEDGAQTYFLRDFDSYCDSEDYGDKIPYPKTPQNKTFWKTVHKALDQAPEAAFNSDILTCLRCGYHYHEVCTCDEDE